MDSQSCTCRDCGNPLDIIQQAKSARQGGGFFELVTCWNRACLLHGMTRALEDYPLIPDEILEMYRDMNRVNQAGV